MITRQDYMDKKVTHREYYAQFVTVQTKRVVLDAFGIDRLRNAFKCDEYLNSIPLQSWDNINGVTRYVGFGKVDGGWSLAGAVCILKEAARQLVEEWEVNHKEIFDK